VGGHWVVNVHGQLLVVAGQILLGEHWIAHSPTFIDLLKACHTLAELAWVKLLVQLVLEGVDLLL